MPEMDLDDEQLPYLKKMKLPSLENLEVPGNFITDEYFEEWITKEKIPKLKRLSISKFTYKSR